MRKLKFSEIILAIFYMQSAISGFSGTADSELRFGRPTYANILESMMVLNSYGVPLSPIKKGQKELTLTPAYIKASAVGSSDDSFQDAGDSMTSRNINSNFSYVNYSENESSGYGGIFSYFHTLGDNWGLAVNLSHIRLSGTLFAMAEYGPDSNPALEKKYLATEEGSATQLSAYIIYDHFAGSDSNFNIPIYFGMGVYDSAQEATGSFAINTTTNGSTIVNYKAEIDTVSFGFLLGTSFQFETGDFRWSPFIMAFIPLERPEYFISATTTEGTNIVLETLTESEGDSFLPSGGLGVSYMPWQLTLRWVPNIFNLAHKLVGDEHNEEISQTVLTLSKTWIW